MKKFILPVILAIFVLAGTGLLLSAGNESETSVEKADVEQLSNSSCSDASDKTDAAMATLVVDCDSDCTDSCGTDSDHASACDSESKADAAQKTAASSCEDSKQVDSESSCDDCDSEKA